MTIGMENYNNSSDNGQDKTEQQSVWTITTIVLLSEKIKLNGRQYGELQQHQF